MKWAALAVLSLPMVSAAESIDYARQVHAVLASRCIVCHSQEKRSGGLSLATYTDVLNGGRSGAAVKPGKSGESLLLRRVTDSGATRMPIGGQPLNASEIAILTDWIDQGARPAPNAAPAKAKWEAPLALTRPALPTVTWKNWQQPVDRFTAAYLAAHKMPEPQPVSDAVFARRAYLDIQGLLPPPEKLREFLASKSPAKRDDLVAALLADKQKYAEHWISYWNDLLRNDEGVTYYSETAGRKSITDWLLAALVNNKPYNQMVQQLLNPTAPDDPDGFLTGVNWRGTVSASQTPALQAAQNTAQIFLGVNLKCNSCHDSFISKWKLKEAYALAAYFSDEEKLKLYRCDIPQEEHVSAGFLFPELNRPLPSMAAADRRAAAAAIFTDPRNGRLPRTLVNRIWQRLMGRGIVENVDEMDGEPWNAELLDYLASEFVSSGYDLKALTCTILRSRTYQLPAIARKADPDKLYTFTGPELRRLTAEQFSDAVASITGEWHAVASRGSARPRSTPLVITGSPVDGSNIRPATVAAAPVRTPAPVISAPQVVNPTAIAAGSFSRGWRIPGSSLERALGRPIRDQVYGTRDSQATTIQALELVNGETLTHWLWRGARAMLGQLPPEPVGLYARQTTLNRGPQAGFEVDISKATKLYLIVQDALSTAPDKAAPVWVQPELIGPNGVTPLTELKPIDNAGLRTEAAAPGINGIENGKVPVLRVKLASVVAYDIAGKGFTRFKAAPGQETVVLGQGENVQARFFVFDQLPSLDRLVPPKPELPIAAGRTVKSVTEAVDRVYWHALGRAPTPGERRVAETALRDPKRPTSPSADGLADLLWAVLMTPEFQLVR